MVYGPGGEADVEEKTKEFCKNTAAWRHGQQGPDCPGAAYELGFTQGHIHIDTGS